MLRGQKADRLLRKRRRKRRIKKEVTSWRYEGLDLVLWYTAMKVW